MRSKLNRKHRQRAASSVMALFFVALFSSLAVSFNGMSNLNLQTAQNHQEVSSAQAAAESGLEFVRHLMNTYQPPEDAYTAYNTVSEDQAEETIGYLAEHMRDNLTNISISHDTNNNVITAPSAGNILYCNDDDLGFNLNVSFLTGVDGEPHQLIIVSTGTAGSISRSVQIAYDIDKDQSVLNYAIASKGRIIMTGDSTVNGNIFSGWDDIHYSNRPAPCETTAETTLNGKVSTMLSYDELADEDIYLESLDEDGEPMFDEDGYRVYDPDDELQGYHEGVAYSQDHGNMPGLSIDDYDTSVYTHMCSTLPASGDTETEYFPHVAGDYTQPKYRSAVKLNRHVYEGQTFTDKVCPSGRSALFRNCTFEGIFCINMAGSGANNVRFENCTFNGPIITGAPKKFDWKKNVLYFTGSAEFNNTVMPETTILAPHFNVNLGNVTAVEEDATNRLTGAIVGGIVDVRGHAEIDGTIISMYDTSPHPQGYVTNIGFANDGGSESSALDPEDDVGVIRITPDPDRLLPSGMISPIVFKKNGNSYQEL